MSSKKTALILNEKLPQTQCQSCGYPDCYTYAEAISEHRAKINRCAPGGTKVIQGLAELTNTPIIPLDKNIQPTNLESTAIIDEEFCIGCTLCIDVCPIDSIIGSAKKTHSILNSLCSGCGLCLPPCPTNCIDIIPLNVSISRTKPASLQLIKLDQASRSKLWKEKYESKQARHTQKTLDLQKKASEESQHLTNLSKAQRIASAMDIARKKLVESQSNGKNRIITVNT